MDMTLFEVDEAANRIRDEVDEDANIIFGSTFNKDLEGKIRVSVVATGIDQPKEMQARQPEKITIATQTTILDNIEPPLTEAAPCIEEKQPEFAEVISSIQESTYEENNNKNGHQTVTDNQFINIRPSNLDNFLHTTQTSVKDAPKPTNKFSGLGLFSKMANSVFSTNNNHHQAEISEEIKPSQAEDGAAKDDLDVPAFLRRKP
jgi:hypothetical protein